jgi:Bacterial conjugation TrbI-like protein
MGASNSGWQRPQGARLIGSYDSQVAFGRLRVLLVRTRLIMPNGRSIVLERRPGADAAGSFWSGGDEGRTPDRTHRGRFRGRQRRLLAGTLTPGAQHRGPCHSLIERSGIVRAPARQVPPSRHRAAQTQLSDWSGRMMSWGRRPGNLMMLQERGTVGSSPMTSTATPVSAATEQEH